jgi:hypothetical protein
VATTVDALPTTQVSVALLPSMTSTNTVPNKQAQYSVARKTVCLKAWLSSLGIKKSTFYNIRAKVISGQNSPIQTKHGNTAIGSVKMRFTKTLACITWMRKYFLLTCEHMSHLKVTLIELNLTIIV